MKSKAGLLLFLLYLALFACDDNPYNQGQFLYEEFCENCHMEDGKGLTGIIPPLAGSDFLKANQQLLPCLIRMGYKGEMVVNGRTYNTEMQGIKELSEFEITNVINYINKAWGNDFEIAKHPEVREALKNCE